MKELLKNRVFFPDSALVDEDGEFIKQGNFKVYPTGRNLVQIARNSYPSGDLRATLKLAGGKEQKAQWLKMMLPAGYFNIQDPESWISRMKSFFDPLFHVSELVVNMPVRLSDDGNYLYCDRTMFAEHEHACRVMPNFVFDFKKNGNAGLFDGVNARSAKTKVNAFGIYYKGKSIVESALPKKPHFLGRDFGSGKEAIIKLLEERVEKPLYYKQHIIIPQLSTYNFHMVLKGLESYFDKVETKLKLKCDYDFNNQEYVQPEIQEIFRKLTAPRSVVSGPEEVDVEV